MTYIIDLFHQIVYRYKDHVVVADFTDLWPQYNVFNPARQWIGCTNASNELSWKSACRAIIENKPL